MLFSRLGNSEGEIFSFLFLIGRVLKKKE